MEAYDEIRSMHLRYQTISCRSSLQATFTSYVGEKQCLPKPMYVQLYTMGPFRRKDFTQQSVSSNQRSYGGRMCELGYSAVNIVSPLQRPDVWETFAHVKLNS